MLCCLFGLALGLCPPATRKLLQKLYANLVVMSAGIQSLPAEVLLNVARYLTIPTIRSLKLSSHYFDEVLSSNEWTVYHNAALNHAYVDDERVSVSEAKTQNSRYPVEHAECATWGEYCKWPFSIFVQYTNDSYTQAGNAFS